MEYKTKLLTIKDIIELFQMSKNTAYKLFKSDGFPSIKIGNKFYVSEFSLNKWLSQNEGKKFSL